MKPTLASKQRCTGCLGCVDSCNYQAISVKEDENGFQYPVIDESKCTECLKCQKECEYVILGKSLRKNQDFQSLPLAAWNRNEGQRAISSSGGAFSAIATFFIQELKGIVVGVALNQNRAHHIVINKQEDLRLIQGVKYTQSNTSGIYKQVLDGIKQDKYVLFSGTPCQISALYGILGKHSEYNKLFTIEVICHGVISNLILDKHLQYNNADTILSFRSKHLGWGKDTYTTVSRKKEKFIVPGGKRNFFYNAFRSESVSRLSCYICPYANINRSADITMGDFWGNTDYKEESKKGLSLLLANNKKGENLIKQSPQLEWHVTTWEKCLPKNPRLFRDKHECVEFTLSNKLNSLFKHLPPFIAKEFIESRLSKRAPLFYLRAWLILKKKIKMSKQIELELQQLLKDLKS